MKPGGKRWRLILLIAAVTLIAAGAYLFLADRGPTYQGRTVSQWFKEYCVSSEWRTYDRTRNDEAREALDKLGTNAVPYLLERAFDTNLDSPLRIKLTRIINSLPRSWPISAPVSHGTMQVMAPNILYRLTPSAELALPFLERQFWLTNSPNHLARRQAVSLMGYLGDGGERAVPLLVEALTDRDVRSQGIALDSLWRLGPKAQAAVPVLEKRFVEETNTSQRLWIAAILFRIDERRTNELGILIESLKESDPLTVRNYTAAMISEIGPDARAAAPALIAALTSTNESFDVQVIRALRSIGVPTRDYLPTLKKQLSSDDPQERVRAARVVTFATPHDADALAILAAAGNAARAQKQAASAGPGTNGGVR